MKHLTMYFVTLLAHLIISGCGCVAQTWESGATTVTLTHGGTLRVSGKGAMEDYQYPSPWHYLAITDLIIEEGVTHIGDRAFFGCTRLMSATISNSVKTIGERAFAETGLTSITIPNGVTSIGNSVFYACTSLISVTIPASVTTIGEDAFSLCRNLISINVATDNAHYSSVDGVLFNKNKTTLIVYPPAKQGAYTIPNGVVTIGEHAFILHTGLTSVTIPSSVMTVAKDAFFGCRSLVSINVATDNTHYSSVDGILFNKNKTTLIHYPRSKQDSIYTIPNGVTTIEEGAFSGCKNLTSIVIPHSMTSIEEKAFLWCRSLLSVTIPGSVRFIGKGAFDGCTGLTSVTIENGVKSIGELAFRGCTGLTSITIPGSVTFIGKYAFAFCENLTSITCLNPIPPDTELETFSVLPSNVRLYIPKGSSNAYKTAEGWRDFTTIIEMED
jgi:hypothetical protein